MPLERRPRADSPGELVFRTCYAPVDLREMLALPDAGQRIGSLPAAQLFFGLQELDETEVPQLLRHVGAEQWREVLDLALWKRDRVDIDRFLGWQSSLFDASPDTARRLLEAPDADLYELAFKRHLRIYARVAEDEFEEIPEGTREWFDTPDKDYRIVLGRQPDRSRLLRGLLTSLYRVNPDRVRLLLASSRTRTFMELEESAYQESRRRMEDQGFQNYFEAAEVYAALSADSRLPVKRPEPRDRPATLPARIPVRGGSPWLLVRALAHLSAEEGVAPLLEEVFFVCNKVLSADGVSVMDARRVKQGIRKALSGINLGLECWSGGDAGRAVEGVRRHYLQSFFQIGHGQLLELRRLTDGASAARAADASSLEGAILEGLNRRYPLYTVAVRGRIRRRFFFRCRDLEAVRSRFA